MRIISPFHDYYDTALSLGYDPTLIYQRRFEIKELRADALDPRIREIFDDADYLNFQAPHYYFEPKLHVIGFCGRLYPVYLAPDFTPSPESLTKKVPQSPVMTYADLVAWLNKSYGKDRGRDWERSRLMRSWKVLDRQGVEIGADTFRLIGAPIWLAVALNSRWADVRMLRVFTNFRTFNLDFQKQFGATAAFQELAMYLGSALAKLDESVRTVGSDEVIAQQKGFGPESFRSNAPSERKTRRKLNRERKKRPEI